MNHHDVIMAMRHPLVLHHGNCMDGFGSAWAIHQAFGNDADYVPQLYGQSNPPDVTGRDVLIVDYSYPRAQLLEMNAVARSLICLDHHKTAQADLEGLDFALFDMNRSGAGLTWDVVHQSKRPTLIEYVEDRDLWRFALPDSKQINAWIGCVEMTFADWDFLHCELRDRPQSVAIAGSAVLRKIDCYVRDMCTQARRIEFAGHADIPVVNAPYINTSELVGELAKSAPFAVGWFHNSAGMYQYSLRSRGDFDVSELAKRFGGGGHRQAAGFSSATMVHS
jgi:oligoribonuclease NrnB/cAMP/cGMP phosphodiesterase (DHH superfamily)